MFRLLLFIGLAKYQDNIQHFFEYCKHGGFLFCLFADNENERKLLTKITTERL